MANKLKEFTVSTARPLPLVLLLDTSGSMLGTNIDSLNYAVNEMISSLCEEDDIRAEIHLSIITFGGSAQIVQELAPISKVKFKELLANGNTPMGAAFSLAQNLIEDKSIIPSRAYTPTVVLVSDGQPNDEWETSLKNLLSSERAKKAMRMVMGIGDDADEEMLQKFSEHKVFKAQDGRDIKKFFKFVTMSVSSRTRSQNPETMIIPDMDDIDNIKF
jgi:uncharacterized protein YegL